MASLSRGRPSAGTPVERAVMLESRRLVVVICPSEDQLDEIASELTNLEDVEFSILARYESVKSLSDRLTAATSRDAEAASASSPMPHENESVSVLRLPGWGVVLAGGALLERLAVNRVEGSGECVRDALRGIGLGSEPVRECEARAREGEILVIARSSSEESAREAGRRLIELGMVGIFEGAGHVLSETPPKADSRSEPDADAPSSEFRDGLVRHCMEEVSGVVSVDTALRDAVEKLRSLNATFLPVLSEGRMVGILTNSEIPVRRNSGSSDEFPLTVGEVMTPDFVFCRGDQSAAEVVELMERLQLSRLPVLDSDGRLIGMIPSPTLLEAGEEQEQLSD